MKGQLKLRLVSDRPDHLERRVKTLYIGKLRQPYTLKSAFQHKSNLMIVTLDGVASRDDAEALRGSEVAIREQDAAPLADDEYFLHQLHELQVMTEAGEAIGTVRDIVETGASDMLVVRRLGKTDALIPMVRDFIVELDIPGGRS
ncbi:16S rRNA processing protein RimM, partial [Candidatus Gracilibacteria bacterium]|nr:16S rRNA processing protein RimM [Candidatus Gracilibacteria bacterium]